MAARIAIPTRIYQGIVKLADPLVPKQFQAAWNHEAGPKTVFFWAPAFKWGLVIAGLGDIQRPVENLSISQSTSLFFTGLIWSRYSLVIIPKNYSLFAVNVFVAITNSYQLFRAIRYQQMQQKSSESSEKVDESKTIVASPTIPAAK